LEDMIVPLVRDFLKIRGLKMKESKTRIINMESEGFDFLGFKFQRIRRGRDTSASHTQTTVLRVTPTRANILKLKAKIRSTVKVENKMELILKELNPVLRG